MPRIFTRVHSTGEFKHRNWIRVLRGFILLVISHLKIRNGCAGKEDTGWQGGASHEEGGDIREDRSPHSTQPTRNWGKDLRARDNLLPCGLKVCLPSRQLISQACHESLTSRCTWRLHFWSLGW